MTGVKISSDFPGGNIVVDSIKGNRVSLHQDLRDTRGDWFYWAFEVEGMKPGPAYFRFSRGDVMEGILSILSDGGDRGRWFGDNVQILAVPFMDRDGVLDGDQGKNRRPHDHNRDYGSDPVHPSVSALKKSVSSLPGKSRKIALDLHCPYIKGGETNHQVYFVGGPGKKNEERVKEFLKVAVPLQTGPVPFTGMNYLPFGTLWNTNDSPEHISCARWMQTVPGMDFASTLEFPYAEAQGIEVTPERARWFGRDLGRGLHRYLSRD